MKTKYSKTWISSKQPRKQRKYRANAPLHKRHKMLSASLSKELRKQYNKRSMPLRKEDEIKVMRGEFKGYKGKIDKVDMKKLKVFIDSAKKKKVSGQEVMIPIDPSNLIITSLNTDDKKRLKALKRGKQSTKENKITHKEKTLKASGNDASSIKPTQNASSIKEVKKNVKN